MRTQTIEKISDLSVATIRTLAIDSVENANHGHLGMPLGAAPMGYTLFKNVMNHNPENPHWYNRDRFVLTSGHGSVLLYTLLHLSGYEVSIDDLKTFRKLGSITPGHPEVDITPGVEATTGPLGQGLAMTIGLALAEAHLAEKYNKPDFDIVDHYTYTICGDGDLMEGVAQESVSLAGHLGLGKLIVLYDSNDVCSDGDLSDTNSEDVQKKYGSMGWQVIRVEDGNDINEIEKAIQSGKEEKNKPTLIEVKTIIGFGSPNKSGTAAIHSNPVGPEESDLIRKAYGWDFTEDFYIPDEVKKDFSAICENGRASETEWGNLLEAYQREYPELSKEFLASMENNFEVEEININFEKEKVATRSASGEVLNAIADKIPLIGGSADLASSNKTTINGSNFISRNDYSGRNINYGVREFGMASIANGLALHGGLKPYTGTFLVFSDYMRSAIRISSIMNKPLIYIFTHDSIMLGQDGPTHQPVEHLASLRAMPNLNIIRPADANETAAAWEIAIHSKETPTAIVLGRHDVPVLETADKEGVKKGAYIISKGNGKATGKIIATGSEVELAIKAQAILEKEEVYVDVISMPSWELFLKQDDAYKNEILRKEIKNILAVEMGSSIGWREFVGADGDMLTINHFGESGDGQELAGKLGYYPENIADRFKRLEEKNSR
ncbi:transketolase [Oceanobacillus sojae]|uniref:Transketolase n=1 Tax=Oceanobacillus sojae TaxID=582851 RepID=A0A511ZHS5_9BACI|nr:transketolase [Oceanobacillus sojae]GEN86999.1 transketolase [Oceanobacillus sojae]